MTPVVDASALGPLIGAIAMGDAAAATRLLHRTPALATAALARGATRQEPTPYWIEEITHYVYGGDTALHVAAAAHRPELVELLLRAGADVAARNRRKATPLHYAVDGSPGSPRWDADRQATTVRRLLAAGADPNATDASGVGPLHRAVRTRSAAAVAALLDGGADPTLPNRSGSTPMMLATMTTGRSGSGSDEAKAQQREILRRLERHGAS